MVLFSFFYTNLGDATPSPGSDSWRFFSRFTDTVLKDFPLLSMRALLRYYVLPSCKTLGHFQRGGDGRSFYFYGTFIRVFFFLLSFRLAGSRKT